MDIMIDLETLGTDSNCPVLSIGAVAFDIQNQELVSSFSAVFDLDEQLKKGRVCTSDTLKWWMSQSKEAQKVFTAPNDPVKNILTAFNDWIKKQKGVSYVWGNGATFDISILENLYSQFGLETGWSPFKVMDLRTFKRFVAPKDSKVKVSGVKHNALDDAKAQAEFVMRYAKAGV